MFLTVKKGLDICKKVDALPSHRGVNDPYGFEPGHVAFKLFVESAVIPLILQRTLLLYAR